MTVPDLQLRRPGTMGRLLRAVGKSGVPTEAFFSSSPFGFMDSESDALAPAPIFKPAILFEVHKRHPCAPYQASFGRRRIDVGWLLWLLYDKNRLTWLRVIWLVLGLDFEQSATIPIVSHGSELPRVGETTSTVTKASSCHKPLHYQTSEHPAVLPMVISHSHSPSYLYISARIPHHLLYLPRTLPPGMPEHSNIFLAVFRLIAVTST